MARPASAERYLPTAILERASLRGNEYAWPIADIPLVIEAARRADLINIGRQLQFRFADGTTCECYWVEVDTDKTVLESQPWSARVTQTAARAREEFEALSARYDFFEEGRGSFSSHFREIEAQGFDPHTAMCFVWYVEGKDGEGGIADTAGLTRPATQESSRLSEYR